MDDPTQNTGQIGVVIDEVLSAATGTVVRGHFEGLAMSEAPEATLQSSLTVNGGEFSLVDWRMGFGEARNRFELRFAQAEGEGTLTVALVAVVNSHDASAAADLRAKLEGLSPQRSPLLLQLTDCHPTALRSPLASANRPVGGVAWRDAGVE